MSYFSIQTLLAVFQGSISLLPLIMIAWKELKIDAKQSLGLPNFHMRDFNGITAHLCVCILNYLVLSWLRYSRGIKLTIGQMVHTVFHELILKAVEEVHHYSLSQDVKSINWLPISA